MQFFFSNVNTSHLEPPPIHPTESNIRHSTMPEAVYSSTQASRVSCPGSTSRRDQTRVLFTLFRRHLSLHGRDHKSDCDASWFLVHWDAALRSRGDGSRDPAIASPDHRQAVAFTCFSDGGGAYRRRTAAADFPELTEDVGGDGLCEAAREEAYI